MTFENFSLKGRTALITGASSGIGYGLAKGLSDAGATIVAAARRVEKLNKLVGEIEAAGGKAVAVSMDVTSRADINRAFAEAQEQVGVADIIINNAGVADVRPYFDTDEESFDFTMDTNMKGVWHVAQEGARRMVEAAKSGSIVNLASIVAFGVQPGYGPYAISKAAVAQMTRAQAVDLARYKIRVNAIAPGWFITEMNEEFLTSDAGQAYLKKTPMRRPGEINELLGPVLMLVSDAGSFVNGVILPVDGAHHTILL